VTSRAGEGLTAAGILLMTAAAAANRELTGNEFVALFGAGVALLFTGMALTFGRRRPR
jgi:hypothetical protein